MLSETLELSSSNEYFYVFGSSVPEINFVLLPAEEKLLSRRNMLISLQQKRQRAYNG